MDLSWFLILALLGCVHSSIPSMYGEITSPNYPQGYPNNVEETWEISVPEGFGIHLYFIHLDIEPSESCEYDYVQVIVGDIVEKKLCGHQSGRSQRRPVEEKFFHSSYLKLLFKSDFSNQQRYTGFAAYYIAVDINECKDTSETLCSHFCNNYIGGYFCSCPPEYFLHPDNHTCGVNCSGGLFTDNKGTIRSPGFPSPYPENTRCEYKVQMEHGFEVIIIFQGEDFDIEADKDGNCYDSLTIKAGARKFGPFCGKNSPNPPVIETGSNEADIIFQTDSGGENRGWKVRYYGDAIQCPMQVIPNSVLDLQQEKYVFRDVVTVTCLEGYEIVKEKKTLKSFRSTCQGDGTWKNSHFQCQQVNCGEPDPIDNGIVTLNRSSTTYGSKIEYSCPTEYYTLTLPAGEDGTYRCSSDGYWVNKKGEKELPTCTPVCGVDHSVDGARIFGGAQAKLGQFPWLIQFTVPELGGGSLISDRWVLTAAHVLKNEFPEMYGGVMKLFPNVNSRPKQNKLQFKKIIVHPLYRGGENYDNDIALIQLSKKVKMDKCISPICLPRRGLAPVVNEVALIAGWGRTKKRDYAINLQFAKIFLSSMDKCKQATAGGGYITANMLCAGSEDGRDSCQGDSGGPLMFKDPQDSSKIYMAGIVSWGPQECGSYGFYTKVDNYLDWIEKTIAATEREEQEEVETQVLCA
ncbi:complement C1s subcomponent precursor [Xenopus laevis]|uniref:Complement C1s subcomponent precursor n=1 Tax=Xenopus laevis TaxID=8355 RepID=A0JMR1_XENLA|nr:complement C1s subcomponent precursor [Xenopus laevis]AAI25975.1 LOC733422 protein [Xenopus laevis]